MTRITEIRHTLTDADKKEIIQAVFERVKAEFHIMPRDYSFNNQFKVSVIEKIIIFVCAEIDITIEEIKKTYRKMPSQIVFSRQAVWFLCRKYFKKHISFDIMGKYFGLDHATVIYHMKTLDGLMEMYPQVKAQIDELCWKFDREFETEIALGEKVITSLKSNSGIDEEVREYLKTKMA